MAQVDFTADVFISHIGPILKSTNFLHRFPKRINLEVRIYRSKQQRDGYGWAGR